MPSRPRGLGSASVTHWLDPLVIERLAADPAQRMRVPNTATIDFSRPFVPEAG